MITDKIENYLNEDEDMFEDDDLLNYGNDIDIMDRMFDFITSLEDLPEDKQLEALDIIEMISPELGEGFAAKRVKIKPAEKRKRKRKYRKIRAFLKMKGRKFRRTAAYKRWKRMKKRKAKSGKTAGGKRIRTFI